MKINPTAPDYKGYRFPPAIISRAVWLYFRFSLSFSVRLKRWFCQNSNHILASSQASVILLQI
jgi:hypothetical protein